MNTRLLKWLLVLVLCVLLAVALWFFLGASQPQSQGSGQADVHGGAEAASNPSQYGQKKAGEINTGVEIFQSLPSDNYHVAMRRGRCNTMYQHLQILSGRSEFGAASSSKAEQEHARGAIRLLAQEMLKDYHLAEGDAARGLRNDSLANSAVWSDEVGFQKAQRDFIDTMVQQAQQNQPTIGKVAANGIGESCQSCHTKYTLNEGKSLPKMAF